MISIDLISKISTRIGLNLVGVSLVPNAISEVKSLKNWQNKGYAGEMSFMNRETSLLTDPNKLLEGYKNIIMFSANYSREESDKFQVGYGKVARYAWGKDYHKVIKKKLEEFISELQKEISFNFNYRTFSDAVPFLERFYATKSGIGFIGKNTLNITPKQGSFSFLAEIICDLEITDKNKIKILDNTCKTCTKCLDNCPTDAFEKEYVLDARKCISYLTIEKRGLLNEWERNAIGEWIFGCDICQEVCPFNHKVLKEKKKADLNEFDPSSGNGSLLNLEKIISIRTDSEFIKLFGGTAIMRAKREGLVRNACIVASNTNATLLIPVLEKCIKNESNETILEHAKIALNDLEVS